MSHFGYQNGELFAEGVNLQQLAETYGTPTYVYSRAALTEHFQAYQQALGDHPGLVCFAVKASSNLAVLNILAKLGAGFDIVSGGELERVIAAGGDPAKIVFSGLGKTHAEVIRALEVGVHCFNIESEAELQLVNQAAASIDTKAPISLRVNPDVNPQTHPYISTGLKENKFGIDIARAVEVYKTAQQMSHINIVGVDCHIGSQLTDITPFIDALDRLLVLIDQLAEAGIHLKHIDIGGGLGVTYDDEQPPAVAEYLSAVKAKLAGRQLELIMEPGRSIAANAGILLTRVQYLKPTAHKNFAIIDAAMSDYIRPALYQAWNRVLPAQANAKGESLTWDLVGSVCETGDWIAKDRELSLQADDLLAVMSTGAYGFTMASNYNTRGKPAEVIVDQDITHLARQRESFSDLIRGEALLPESN